MRAGSKETLLRLRYMSKKSWGKRGKTGGREGQEDGATDRFSTRQRGFPLKNLQEHRACRRKRGVLDTRRGLPTGTGFTLPPRGNITGRNKEIGGKKDGRVEGSITSPQYKKRKKYNSSTREKGERTSTKEGKSKKRERGNGLGSVRSDPGTTCPDWKNLSSPRKSHGRLTKGENWKRHSESSRTRRTKSRAGIMEKERKTGGCLRTTQRLPYQHLNKEN